MSEAEGMSKTYRLQVGLLPLADAPAELYLRGADSFTLAPRARLDGNTYFNAFYLDYWRRYASLSSLGLSLDLDGDAFLRIIGEDADGQAVTLAMQSLSAGQNTVWLDPSCLAPDCALGRLYFDLTAKTDLSIGDIAWISDDAPRREVSLSVGLCTFNREDHLAVTLDRLEQYASRTPAIMRIFVVNQGEAFGDAKVLTALKNPVFQLIEQENFGGCGGFNRTMIEAVNAAPAASHHLLMDDDILLDPRMLSRAARFLEYTKDPIALGGSMLELGRKTMLHEAGARLESFWHVVSVERGANLADANALEVFATVDPVHYNAWWFCVIPIETIRRLSFSPPLFLHFDDIEYGCRMLEAGVETVALPGVAVWHETFAYKQSDWILYYDFRNRLISATLHPDLTWRPDALFVLGFMMNFILIHRYRAASLAALALRDYLKGPASLGPDPLSRHDAVQAFLARFPVPEERRNIDLDDVLPGSADMPPGSILATVRVFFAHFFLNLFRVGLKKPRLFHGATHPMVVGNAPVLMAKSVDSTVCSYYPPNRWKLVSLTLQALILSAKFLIVHRWVVARWRAATPDLTSEAGWRAIFRSRQC